MDLIKIKVRLKLISFRKKKQEYKFLGAGKKKKGQKLFALNNKNGQVSEVILESQKTLDLTNPRKVGKYKVFINPDHSLMWAINQQNAERKFQNSIKKHIAQLKTQ